MIEIDIEQLRIALWTKNAQSFWDYTWHEEDEYHAIKEQFIAQVMGWA